MKYVLYLFFILMICPSLTSGSNILILYPFDGTSQWLFLKKFIEELLNRNHHVTSITNEPFGKQLQNYTEVLIEPPIQLNDFFLSVFQTDSFESDTQLLWDFYQLGLETSKYTLANDKVQKFIQRDDLHYDLVISDLLIYESWFMFGHKFKAPIIGINTYGCTQFYDYSMGLLTPWSFVPHQFLPYTDNMSLAQRLYNVWIFLFDTILRNWYYMPKQNQIAKVNFQYLEKFGPLPTLEQLEQSISVILVNEHRSFIPPRPSMPGLINIGGAHITKPKPLPTDIQTFLDESPNGAIYFCLGSNAKSSNMPVDKINMFLETFKQLKQKVLWKFEDEDKITNLPSNVMIRKWMPQSDILAHKNVVLFISHGGLFGTMEGLERGVPSLFIPLFGDQYRNSLKSVNLGYSLMLKFGDITMRSLFNSLEELLTNPKYRHRAQELSAIFKDNPINPMNESMYWIEYVIKYKGAAHLKSYAINLPVWSYLLLDVIGIFLLGITGMLIILICFIKKIQNLFKRKHLKNNENGKKIKSKLK